MVTLHNDFLTVTASPAGAELTSVKNNLTGVEYLWQADPKVWKRHAPVLFPIVGKLQNDAYTFEGKTYHMTQHGFARDREFDVLAQSETQVSFVLRDDDETRAMYPFAFELVITYTLDNNLVHVDYQVTNPDTKQVMYFAIGAHPGFNIPVTDDTKFTDYYMSFEPKKSRVQIPLVAGKGIDYAHRTLAATDVNQALNHEFFKDDAVIYELNGRTKFSIVSDKTKHGVSLSVSDAPFMGVWSPYPTTGDFVCIEPWWGIADTIEHKGDFTDKLGINTLEPGAQITHSYSISIF